MKPLVLLFVHVLTALARHLSPGGVKAIIAESVLVKHQHLIAHRSAGKPPRLTTVDRFFCGFLTLFMRAGRIRKAAVVIKPATLTKFRRALISRNYQRLFSSQKKAKPGPKGPSDDLIRVIVEFKRRNPRFGCPRIAQQINHTFGMNLNKEVVRRVLAKYYHPVPYDNGPSWRTFPQHTRDSLASIALPGRESILRKLHSILLAIAQLTRRMIGFSFSGCHFHQSEVCSPFDAAIPIVEASKSLSPAHHPAFSHHRYRRNCSSVDRMQTVAPFPRSPPFVEARIRTRGRKHHDHRSEYDVIECEAERKAFNDYHELGLMPVRVNEHRLANIDRETAFTHSEGQNLVGGTRCRQDLRNLIAA